MPIHLHYYLWLPSCYSIELSNCNKTLYDSNAPNVRESAKGHALRPEGCSTAILKPQLPERALALSGANPLAGTSQASPIHSLTS